MPGAQVDDPQTQAPLPPLHVPPPPASQSTLLLHRQIWLEQLKPGGHERPHAPQLEASMSGFTQPAGVWQHRLPGAHFPPPLHEQTSFGPAFLHTSPGPQVVWPQVQRPPPQVPPDAPVLHEASPLQPHWVPPLAHTSPAPWSVQLLPQPPHERSLPLESVSQPSSPVGAEGFEQFALPSTQLDVQTPPEHARESTPLLLHARPQAPQWSAFDAMLASQPSPGLPLQSL